jgi:hypothetical protein
MSKPNLKLKNIISSDKVKIFETNYGVLIGNVDRTDTFNNDTSTDNIYSMFDVTRSQILNNLYEIEQTDIQTNNTTLSKSNQTNTPTDFIEQYNPANLAYKSIAQFNIYGFMLSNDTIDGLRQNGYNTISEVFENYNQQPNVYTYPPSGEITLSGTTSLSGNMVPIYDLSGISFNYMSEIDTTKTYFDYTDSLIYGNTTNLKNHMNELWNTGSNVTDVTTTSVSATLDNVRDYNKICSSDNGIHFTYNHTKSYVSSSVTSIKNDREFDDYSLSALTLSASLTEIPMSGYISEVDEYSDVSSGYEFANKFEYVESIRSDGEGGFNKYGKISGHKSNMYSINIQNANINSNEDLDDIQKEEIKQSINNIIRDVIEACTPTNTQLANIYWNGD